jgi:hypothetical protein
MSIIYFLITFEGGHEGVDRKNLDLVVRGKHITYMEFLNVFPMLDLEVSHHRHLVVDENVTYH